VVVVYGGLGRGRGGSGFRLGVMARESDRRSRPVFQADPIEELVAGRERCAAPGFVRRAPDEQARELYPMLPQQLRACEGGRRRRSEQCMTVLPGGGKPGLVTRLVDRQRRVVPSHVFGARRRTIMQNQDEPAGLVRAVEGIDAAITARHHIAVREFFEDGRISEPFHGRPDTGRAGETLAAAGRGSGTCDGGRGTDLDDLAGAGTGCRTGRRPDGNDRRPPLRAAARGASWAKKSDVIYSEVLTHAGEIFDPPPSILASPGQLALRRAVVRRAGAVIDGNRYWRRLLSLAR
jgi:hypothetical protein